MHRSAAISQYNYTDGYRITLSGQALGGTSNWMNATGSLAAGFTGLDLANPQNLSITAVKPDNRTLLMQQWNLQVQQLLPQNIVVSAAYVGAAGRHPDRPL